jgi:predicted NUDIX family phosphoesterase
MKFCLVVPRTAIGECQRNEFELISESWLKRLLDEESFFAERAFMEKTSKYVQIIPYTVVCVPDPYVNKKSGRILSYRRAAKHDEQRLASKWSVGFGGHIDPGDLGEGMSKYQLIKAGRERELQEELGESDGVPCGDLYLLNDLSDEVGSVHLGIVEQVLISSPEIDKADLADEIGEIKWLDQRTEKWGEKELEKFEGWSRIVLKNLYNPK